MANHRASRPASTDRCSTCRGVLGHGVAVVRLFVEGERYDVCPGCARRAIDTLDERNAEAGEMLEEMFAASPDEP